MTITEEDYFITGRYESTLFRNEKTGYTGFLFLSEKETFVCFGKIPRYSSKTPLVLKGHFENNGEKKKFIVSDSVINIFDKENSVIFLQNCLLPGMGRKAAEKLQEILGNDWKSVFEDYRTVIRIKENLEIPVEQASVLLAIIQKNFVCKDIYDEISLYGGSYKNAYNIHEVFGSAGLERLHSNPYTLVKRCKVPLDMMDAYAKDHNIPFYEDERIDCFLNETFFEIEGTGSTYVEYPKLISIFRKIETLRGAYEEKIPEVLIKDAIERTNVGIEEIKDGKARYYLKRYYHAEKSIAEILKNRMENPTFYLTEKKIEELRKENTKLDETQTKVFHALRKSGLSILIGGPGTGKTSTIQSVVKYFNKYFPDKSVSLCAPSARASQRIMESSGMPAQTIHSLLEFKSVFGTTCEPERNAKDPLDADLIIIDEFSMVGTILFQQFLMATRPETIILCVGDANQLGSVEAGKVLSDLIESGLFPVYELTKIYRQEEGNSIITNSLKIKNRMTDLICDESFHIIRCSSSEEMIRNYEEISKKYYNSGSYSEFQSMAPMKRNILGTENLNLLAQRLFVNPNMNKIYYGENAFYEGDKILTTRNNYDSKYMNGDIGLIRETGRDYVQIETTTRDVTLKEENLEDLSLGYCITVHKMQGSESDVIVLMLPKDVPSSLMNNPLVYVGITRAKKEVYIITEEDSLEKAILTEQMILRKTTLVERLLEK